jgi:hypothetical protein
MQQSPREKLKARLQSIFKAAYPYANATWDLWLLSYNIRYLFEKTPYYRPWLAYMGVDIRRMSVQDYVRVPDFPIVPVCVGSRKRERSATQRPPLETSRNHHFVQIRGQAARLPLRVSPSDSSASDLVIFSRRSKSSCPHPSSSSNSSNGGIRPTMPDLGVRQVTPPLSPPFGHRRGSIRIRKVSFRGRSQWRAFAQFAKALLPMPQPSRQAGSQTTSVPGTGSARMGRVRSRW